MVSTLAKIGLGVPDARNARIAEEASIRETNAKAATLSYNLAKDRRAERDAKIKDEKERMTVTLQNTGAVISDAYDTLAKAGPNLIGADPAHKLDSADTHIAEWVKAKNAVYGNDPMTGEPPFSESDFKEILRSKIKDTALTPEQEGAAAATKNVTQVEGEATALGRPVADVAQARGMVPAPAAPTRLEFRETETPAGKYIVGLDPQTGQEKSRIPSGPTPKGAFEDRVDELLQRGFPLPMAQDIAANRLQLAIDPVSQEPMVVNLATQQRVPVPGSVAAFAQAGAAQQGTGTVFDAIGGVGAIPFFKQAASRTIGQFTEAANFPEISAARTRLKGLREQIIVAFAKSGRPPIVEQERILQMIPSLGPFESVPNATATLAELRSQLVRQHVDDLSYAARTDQPAEERRKALVRAEDVRRVIDFIGEPPADVPTSYQRPDKPLSEWTDQELMLDMILRRR